MAGPREKEKEAALRQCAAQLRSGEEAGRRLQALLALRRKHLKEPGADERFRSAGGVRRLLGIVQRYNNNW
ncbi:hypothetical protein chiPu_0030741, partial [Chiloscyllium punctatum]|nr:hypothetical protein [Chiloscyllium punctatum]